MTVTILKGDCRDVLKTLPDESVHCVVTSPPYWGLRDYGVAGQIGLEATPDAFVSELVAVFREVRRVLRKDGTVWLNLGDSYCSGGRATWRSGASENKGQDVLNDMPRPAQPTDLKPKDLIGIPWRVAFALQAPDYLGRIRSEADRAWLAALTDGEGCITILEAKSPHGSGSSYPPVLQVRMCDREMIDKAMFLVGSDGESPAQYPPSQGGVRPAFQWRIHGRKAADTIAEIYPWLLIKRKQAIIVWNAQAAREGYETKRGVKIPVAALEKQKLCKELINRLNQKETVDLPSWMVEPPQPVGPGWYLRQDLIWSKPNPMPESVTDRCTKAHEYIFLLSKAERYYYDAEAIAEQQSDVSLARRDRADLREKDGWSEAHFGNPPQGVKRPKLIDRDREAHENFNARWLDSEHKTRNKRSVWEIATAPFSEAHFATFPPALIEPCILAGCPKGGAVLDPFGGAGTTGLVADRLGRNAILVELNPEYAAMAERRIKDDAGMFASVEIQ